MGMAQAGRAVAPENAKLYKRLLAKRFGLLQQLLRNAAEARWPVIAPQHARHHLIVDLDYDRLVPGIGPLDQRHSERHPRDFGCQYITFRTRHRPALLGDDPSPNEQHSGTGCPFPAACPIYTDYDAVVHSFAEGKDVAIPVTRH